MAWAEVAARAVRGRGCRRDGGGAGRRRRHGRACAWTGPGAPTLDASPSGPTRTAVRRTPSPGRGRVAPPSGRTTRRLGPSSRCCATWGAARPREGCGTRGGPTGGCGRSRPPAATPSRIAVEWEEFVRGGGSRPRTASDARRGRRLRGPGRAAAPGAGCLPYGVPGTTLRSHLGLPEPVRRTERPNGPTYDFRTPPGGGPAYSDRLPRAVSAVAADDSGDRRFQALRPAPTPRQPIPPGADQDSHTTPTYGLVASTAVEDTPVGFREAERHPCVGRRYGRILPPSALSGTRRVRNPDRCP
jgi:hypothetical protein